MKLMSLGNDQGYSSPHLIRFSRKWESSASGMPMMYRGRPLVQCSARQPVQVFRVARAMRCAHPRRATTALVLADYERPSLVAPVRAGQPEYTGGRWRHWTET